MKKDLLLLSCCLLICTTVLPAQIRVYQQLPNDEELGIGLSNLFEVSASSCTGSFEPITTYAFTPNDDQLTQKEHITMLGFDPKEGPVVLRVVLKSGHPLQEGDIELMNKTYPGITTSFSEGAFLLQVCEPNKYLSLRMPSNEGNPLVIQLDPFDDPPIPAGAKVVRFEGGRVHEQTATYDRYTVPNDVDVVVVEDGALFKGTIHTASNRSRPLTIQGRGVMVGRSMIKPGNSVKMQYNQLELRSGNGHNIYGLTLMNSRHFAVRVSDNAHVRNVKFYGYRTNNDGIVAGTNSLIEDCFFKVNDDHVKLYNPRMRVRNCVFYHQTNGAIFQMAWNKIDPGDNCLVENIELIACEGSCGDPALGEGGIARSFINHRESDEDGKVSANTYFRNIYISCQMDRFICLNGYSFHPITYRNLVLENITLEQAPKKVNWLYADRGTGGSTSIEITFKNVRFGDRPVRQSDFKTLGDVRLMFEDSGDTYTGTMNPQEAACLACSEVTTATEITEQQHAVEIYPNPFRDKIRVLTSAETFSVFGLSGKQQKVSFRKNEKGFIIYTDSLPAGMYLIEVGGILKKIVKY